MNAPVAELKEPHGSSRLGYAIGPSCLIAGLWRNRALTKALVIRDLLARFRGSYAGPVWYLIQNVALLAIYSFVFGQVFNTRWPQMDNAHPCHFAASLFVGLLLFNVFAETVGRAPSTIISSTTYVKNIVFPLDILCVVNLGAALFNCLIGFAVLLVAAGILGLPITSTVVFLPAVLPPIVLFSLGVSWFFSALAVYVRDAAQVVGLLVTGLMFFSPIFYPASALPETARWLLLVNPLSFPIEGGRNLIFSGSIDLQGLCLSYAIGSIVAYLGWVWFQIMRRGFSDVL